MSDKKDWLAYCLIVGSASAIPTSIYGGSTESLGGDSGEVSISMSENPGSATVASLGVSSFATSISGPDAVIEVFFKNKVPYTYTEKKAEQLYNSIHKEKHNLIGNTVLIAESEEAMETASLAFCKFHGKEIMDQLDFFEKLLENVSNNKN